jgi:hypothetical protein
MSTTAQIITAARSCDLAYLHQLRNPTNHQLRQVLLAHKVVVPVRATRAELVSSLVGLFCSDLSSEDEDDHDDHDDEHSFSQVEYPATSADEEATSSGGDYSSEEESLLDDLEDFSLLNQSRPDPQYLADYISAGDRQSLMRYTVKTLSGYARRQGLSGSGSKAVLVDRLLTKF